MGKLLQTAVCINLMKLLLMTFNIIFGVTGLVLLILGVWMNVSLYHVLKLSTDYNRHMPLLFIATGLLVLLVAVLACVATAKGQSALLYIFGSLLVLVFVAELTAGIVGYVYIRQVREGIGRGMNSSLTHYTGSGGMADETVDFVQGKLSCCGLNSPDDWTSTTYYTEHNAYPKSCCSGSATCVPNSPTIHSEGCYVKVIRFLDTNLSAIAGGAVGFAFFQLLGVLLSFCLASNINKAKYERV
uniref:Tetraspanin n=2 Tax=Amblyomma TaxID=6942 RepID=G3MS47_AMBMU